MKQNYRKKKQYKCVWNEKKKWLYKLKTDLGQISTISIHHYKGGGKNCLNICKLNHNGGTESSKGQLPVYKTIIDYKIHTHKR